MRLWLCSLSCGVGGYFWQLFVARACLSSLLSVALQVDGLDGINVVDFAIGSKHALVLDDAGSVFSWGWGGSFFGGAGALGHGDKTSYAEPTLVRDESQTCAHPLLFTRTCFQRASKALNDATRSLMVACLLARLLKLTDSNV